MHFLYVEDDSGELVDALTTCSDACSRELSLRDDIPYYGWCGCHEVEFTTYCDNCGVVLPGTADWDELCPEQQENVVINRFKVEQDEYCQAHGTHLIQVAVP